MKILFIFPSLLLFFDSTGAPPPVKRSEIAIKADTSISVANEPKHYLRPSIFNQSFVTPDRKVKNAPGLTYRFAETITGFTIPVFTKTKWHEAEARLSSTHILLSGALAISEMDASFTPGIKNLTRFGTGFKLIHNDGKKNSFFVAVNPYAARERAFRTSGGRRLSTMFVYNRTVNEKFSFRLGFWRTYMIGYPSTLPVIGARLGRYQGINVNLELPRSISLNVPVASWLQMSAFTKVQGSMYAFRNEDLNQFNRPTEILLGRRDVLSGLQANMRIGRMLALSVAAGACTGEVVRSEKTDRRLIGGRRYEFSRQDLLAAPFLQTGITLYMGKSKSNGGNNQMLDVLDLNSRYGTDDGNVQQNGETPFKANETLHKVQLRDVADLLEEQDLY